MQELLAKIIEMDANARRMKAVAEQEKQQGEEEIEKLRQQIYDDYITRARERVKKTIAVDRQEAEDKYSESCANAQQIIKDLEKSYSENGDRWVDEIVKRVLT